MKRAFAILLIVATGLVAVAVAAADQPPATTFAAVLVAEQEVPGCATATGASRGLFVGHVVDSAAGTVDWRLVANNLPGSTIAAHIHAAPFGVAGAVVQPLPFTAGAENGVIGTGTFTNPGLVAAIQANPGGYYVNVHTIGPDGCPPGVIRGQLDLQGPSNN
jgi:CHRD domain-containing protein